MPKLFDDLSERLLVAGFAPRHVRRYAKELRDHYEDLRAAGHDHSAALDRIGRVEDLVKAMAERRELQSWAARAPWATFVLAPPVILALAFVASVLVLIALVVLRPAAGLPPVLPAWSKALAHAIVWFAVYLMPLVVGGCVAHAAVARRLPILWPLIGLAAVACFGGATELAIHFPAVSGGEPGRIEAGFGFFAPFPRLGEHILRGLFNFVILASPYILAMHRVRTAPRLP